MDSAGRSVLASEAYPVCESSEDARDPERMFLRLAWMLLGRIRSLARFNRLLDLSNVVAAEEEDDEDGAKRGDKTPPVVFIDFLSCPSTATLLPLGVDEEE